MPPTDEHGQPEQATNVALDWKAALESVGGDRELLGEILEATLEEWPRCLHQVEVAIQQSDAALLRLAAHTMNLRLFGQTHACELAERMEAIGRSGSCDGAAELLLLLKSAVEAALREIRAFLEARKT